MKLNTNNLMRDALSYSMHHGCAFSWVRSKQVQKGAFGLWPQNVFEDMARLGKA